MGFWKSLFSSSQPAPPPPPPAPPVPETGAARRYKKRPWKTPFLENDLKSYGDARFANPQVDHGAMEDLLTTDRPTAIYLGESTAILHGKMPWEAWYSGERHLLTVAPTGSGKGSCCIIPNLLLQNELSILCIDPKGQNAAVTRRMRSRVGPVFLLNPFNEHGMGTHSFNPLYLMGSKDALESGSASSEVASLCEALIVTEGDEPHWADSARDLVKAMILHLIELEGCNATLPKVRKLLTQDEEGFLTTIVRMSRSKYPFIANPASRFKTSSEEIGNIRSHAINQTQFLDDPGIAHVLGGAEATAKSDLQMLDLKVEPCTVFVILPANKMMAFARFFRLIVTAALDQLSSVPSGNRTLLMLDEFPLMGHLSAIETAFSLSRGYNVQLWGFVQNLTQLKDIYQDRWESLIGNSGVVQWFTPNDLFTANYLSSRVGKKTVSITDRSDNRGKNYPSEKPGHPGYTEGYSTSEKEAAVDFLSPQTLIGLPDYLQILTLAGLQYPVLLTKDHYWEWPRETFGPYLDMCDPDPFHRK